jgi:hypothetical protein
MEIANMTKKQAFREIKIQVLAMQVVEKAQTRRGGSAAMVPSATKKDEAGNIVKYRVDVDENYNPIACQCQGGHFNCQHKQAFSLYIAPKLASLLNSDVNPVYELYRNGVKVRARLSQFSVQEKQALREWQQAEVRAAYEALYDPNMVA